jgi:hypothetical protein
MIILVILIVYYNNKNIEEQFNPQHTELQKSVEQQTQPSVQVKTTLTPKELQSLIENNPSPSPVPIGTTVSMSQPPEKYNAKDFLPKEINNKWFDTDFSIASKNVTDDNLINPDRYIIGINSVASSLKISSHDIRGTIPNPKYVVSPWNNSSVSPDTNIKSLC